MGILSRLLCPETCGCSDFTSTLLFIGTNDGCPQSCGKKCKEKLKHAQCTDTQPDDRAFAALAVALVNFTTNGVAERFSPHWVLSAVTQLSKFGCGHLSDFSANLSVVPSLCTGGLSLADGGYILKSMAPFCPRACSCKQGMENCPSTCLDPP